MERDQQIVTAYHEAGHAVAAWACGFNVNRVVIRSEGNSLGNTELDITPEHKGSYAAGDPTTCNHFAVVGLGGNAAEYLYRQSCGNIEPDEALVGGVGDTEKVQAHLSRIARGSQRDILIYLAWTSKFLKKPDAWSVVERVAVELNHRCELSHSELADHREATPKIDDQFWSDLDMILRYADQNGGI